MSFAWAEQTARTFYFDRAFNLRAVKILPGEYYASREQMVLATVLGSCVSACVWDSSARVGGMNHFMLPGDAGDGVLASSARYGVYAMEVLINELQKLGAKRPSLRAKVFGGGSVIGDFRTLNIGERNADFVRKFLQTEKIPLVAEDLLDCWPRKVCFFPHSGRVLVKKLRELDDDEIMRRERDYDRRLTSSDVAGDVELFA